MKCPTCGQEVQGNFCQNCGTKIEKVESQPEKKNKPKKKGHGCATVLIVVFVIFAILAAIGGNSETDSDVSGGQEALESATPQSTSEQQVQPDSTEEPAVYDATSESMQQLFENTFDFEYDELSCSIVEEDGVNACNITYKNTGVAWDESAFVRQILSAFIDFQRLAYDVDGIGAVRFEVWQDITYDRGNTESDLCYQLMMDKDTFALYSWDTLSGHPILQQMQRDCAEFYIHPGILNNVNDDDVIYHSYAF